MEDYKKYNASAVLVKVEELLDNLNYKGATYNISDIYKELSIFDWWNESLGKSKLLDMRKFLKEAIKLGFTGYVCFKVGASGCANGMWAHKEETTDGYSPKGACLYKSFTPDYECWAIDFKGKGFLPKGDKYDSLKTIKDLENFIEEINEIREYI